MLQFLTWAFGLGKIVQWFNERVSRLYKYTQNFLYTSNGNFFIATVLFITKNKIPSKINKHFRENGFTLRWDVIGEYVTEKWGQLATYPAFLTAPVQLKEAAAVPVCFALYGEFITLSPSSSSETAVVRDIRSSSDIW